MIQNEPYLKSWNDTIFGNATIYYDLPPVVYHMDGDSGILDNAREIKMRVKAFSYVYRMTNDSKWLDRTFVELQVRNRTCGVSICTSNNLFYRTLPETERPPSVPTRKRSGTLATSSTSPSSPPRSPSPTTGCTMRGPRLRGRRSGRP